MAARIRLDARGATLAVLAAGFVLTVALNWPGHLSYDSVVQLADGRAGAYHTWHPPLMAWLLGLCDALVPGAGMFVVLQATLLSGALAAMTWARPRVGWAAPSVAALIAASPLVVVWQGIVWKDVLFADLMVAGFAALSLKPRGAAAAVAGMTLLGAAALVRQNGIVAPLGGVVALAVGWGARRGLAVAAVALLATLAGVATVDHALAMRRVDVDGPSAQLDALHAYDLAGVLARAPATPLPALPPPLAADLRRAARTLYTPVRTDPLNADAALQHDIARSGPALTRQWRDTVRAEPLAWLRHRAAVFRQVALTPSLELCHTDFTGVDGDPALLHALGITPGWSARDVALAHYAAAFHPTPVYSHAAYALLALTVLGVMAKRRRAGDVAPAAMLLSSLAFAASFALIGVACDYRYLYALDLAAMAAAFHMALGWASEPRRDESPHAPPGTAPAPPGPPGR